MPKFISEALATLRLLADAPVTLSDADRDVLRAWPGWGPLAPAFNAEPQGAWHDFANELDTLLDDNARGHALEATPTSFYTPPQVLDAVYDILSTLGVDGGRLLDLGTGTGRFIEACPFDATFVGVESDPTSATIASLLHPQATIYDKPLQDTSLGEGTFDAVVGNIPFSTASVFSSLPAGGSFYGKVTDLFVQRAIEACVPGGYVVLVTPRGVVDHLWPGALSSADKADLLAAVRMPSGIFRDHGTMTSADIVVFRRRAESHNLYGQTAFGTSSVGTLDVSRLWFEHPEWVAGTIEDTGIYQAPMRVASDAPDADFVRSLDAVLAHLRSLDIEPVRSLDGGDTSAYADLMAHGLPGTYRVEDGAVSRIAADGTLEPVKASKELRALLTLRDAVVPLFEAEADRSTPDEVIAPLRDAALARWREYVAAYGPLNRGQMHEGAIDAETGAPKLTWRRPRLGGFRSDPSYLQVMAIEVYDSETDTAEPAPILLHRINVEPQRATSAQNIAEALTITLGESGQIDLPRIGSLMGLDEQAARDALLAGELAFIDPASDELVTARDYLSGNVRAKRRLAERVGLETNVAALRAVEPPVLGPEQIDVRLGMPWLPVSDIRDFARDVLGLNTPISHLAAEALWEVDHRGRHFGSAQAVAYGTNRMNPGHLLEHALNGKTPVIYDEEYDSTTSTVRRVRNGTETMAAVDRLRAIHDAFSTWVWTDAERTERIVATYDNLFGGHVSRTKNGDHLTMPGLSHDVSLWAHQRAMVDMALSRPRTLCAHAVGAGKTLTAIATAMTARTFGLANRPMIAVPSHLLEQIAREAQQAYPGARLLVASKEELAGDARRLFAARCITGDWDAVIMTHESLISLPLSPQVETDLLTDLKSDYMHALNEENATGQSSRGTKLIAKMLTTYNARISQLRSGTNDATSVAFDHLGIDYLIVDECHNFRRHPATASRAEGFSLGSSKRAADLSLKMTYLANTYGDKPHAMLMTGTPFVNTLAETFVWLTYLMPDRLRRLGIHRFDAFAAMFIEYVTAAEIAPDGSGFRVATRPAAITNLPELMALFDEVAYFLPSSELDVERPEVEYHEVSVERGPAQIEVMDDIVERAAALQSGQGRDGDNMLVLCGLGRRVALDPALVGHDEESAKLRVAAEKIASLHVEHPRCLQMVCLDVGTPKPNDSESYGRLRAMLIEHGIPAGRIRFIHEATTDKQRAALFAACRNGEVSVIFGSTPKLGVGVNVQRNLLALHHVDAPWTPADVEQREGRIIRFGNSNPTVHVYRYVTTGSFDAYMWQTLVRKVRFTTALLRAAVDGSTSRRIEDVSPVVLDYGHVLAAASGNPLLAELAEASNEVRRLSALEAVHRGQINSQLAEADRIEKSADALGASVVKLRDLADAFAALTDEDNATMAQRFEQWITPIRDAVMLPYYYSCIGEIRFTGHATSEGYTIWAGGPGGLQLDLRRKDIRRATENLVAILDEAFGSGRVDLHALAAERSERASELRERADEMRRVTSGLTFEHAEALTKARSRRMLIELEIQAATEQPEAA